MQHRDVVELRANQGWDERILVCHNPPLVDTYIVVTARYVVVVDTMINAATGQQLLALAQPHLGSGRSLLVVNSHADYDHCWGNQVFAARGVPIIGSKRSLAVYHDPETPALHDRLRRAEPAIFADVQPVPPTILFEQNLRIDGSDLTLEIIATPGHTADHCSLYIPHIQTLLTADAAELPFPLAHSVDGLPQMRASLAQLAALDATTVLHCHASVTMGGQLLHDNSAYFDRLEAACRAALARGLPADPPVDSDVAALVGLPYEDAVPPGEPWQQVSADVRSGHAQQLRQMLHWVAGASDI
jgi:glyoxylase-like metal-dependent hydrolase (beta-lactamase superfamily II)